MIITTKLNNKEKYIKFIICCNINEENMLAQYDRKEQKRKCYFEIDDKNVERKEMISY